MRSSNVKNSLEEVDTSSTKCSIEVQNHDEDLDIMRQSNVENSIEEV